MGTTANKLLYLQDTKVAIKEAIEAKGVSIQNGTTFRNYAAKIASITTGGGDTPAIIPWVENESWISIPNNLSGIQKVSILSAVFDTDSEYVAFTCAGNYTVDWGDGTSQNFNSGVKAEHKYDYANANLNSNFGAYKQCIITITPQSGKVLSSVLLNDYHSAIGNNPTYKPACNFLKINLNSASLATFRLNYTTGGVANCTTPLLESVIIGEHALTRFDSLFRGCVGLCNLEVSRTDGISLFQSAFQDCTKLQAIPALSLNVAANLNNTFNNCRSLVSIQDINITLVSNSALVGTFQNCTSLRTVNIDITTNSSFSCNTLFSGCSDLEGCNLSVIGTGKISETTSMFASCVSLRSGPVLDTSACSLFSSMFSGCVSLIDLPKYDYTSASILGSMFSGCVSLQKVPVFNTTDSLTTLTSMFAGCVALVGGAEFESTNGVTAIGLMYNNCSALSYVPQYSFPAIVGTANTVFGNCQALSSIPEIYLGNPTATSAIFSGLYSLKRMLMPLKYSFSVAQSKMSATALNEMYTMLPTVTGQTITITGTIGASGDTPSIATAKGWTVTG